MRHGPSNTKRRPPRQVKLEEFMGELNDSEDEDQPRRKRPRTMGVRKALEKQKEEEAAIF